MRTGYRVIDAMTTKPFTVSDKTSVRDCAKIMKKHSIGSLLVMNGPKLVGIVIADDIIFSAASKGFDFDRAVIRDVMVKDLVTIAPDRDIFDAMMLMRDNHIKHLPVLEGDKLIGFLTYKDVLKIQPQLFEILVEKFKLREEHRKPIFGFPEDDFQ
jgi:CBS domain-containing protein